ncbi:MAG: hypothetical protein ABL986_16690 [Vicinamibacterales bacterium]
MRPIVIIRGVTAREHDPQPPEAYRETLDAIPPESCFSQRDRKKQDWRPDEPAPASAAVWQVLNGAWLEGVAARRPRSGRWRRAAGV